MKNLVIFEIRFFCITIFIYLIYFELFIEAFFDKKNFCTHLLSPNLLNNCLQKISNDIHVLEVNLKTIIKTEKPKTKSDLLVQ